MTTEPHEADVRRALEAVRTGDPAQYIHGVGAWNEHAATLADALEAAEEKLRRLTPHPSDGPEPQCPTCAGPVHRDMAGTYWTTRTGEHELAEARIKAVRELHHSEIGDAEGSLECARCRDYYPCDTIRALDGEV